MLRIHSPHVNHVATACRSQIAPTDRVGVSGQVRFAPRLLIAPRPNAAIWRACMALKDETLSLNAITATIAADALVATLFRAVCRRIEPRTIGQQSIERLLILLGRRRSLYLVSGLIAADICARLHVGPVNPGGTLRTPLATTSMNSCSPPAVAWLAGIINAATTAERTVAVASAKTKHSPLHLGQTFANSLFEQLGQTFREQSIIGDSTQEARNSADSNASSRSDRLLAIWMRTWNIPMELHPHRRQIRQPKLVREPACTP